ncbi:acyclic terpene utilization AtuA family protein [Croceicoccus sp. F390]|uniref:Acyclic terpene utilization AtuA family protein n=1 Tax=Croceicoccus esteveae TaxID=3075597 RepID=A0ABU2ZKK8_9SPHN|nr:acyclic terpene utilization AtuA family protein [Croceicoccus sp. F390]MDT0575942.1 acyclic terpene utilization AtuA family protein [Croceicoccus sp. F390]
MAAVAGDEKIIRIGGATASFSDTALSVPQLLNDGRLDYLVFDYLAEGSMGIFGRMQAADPTLGYGTDFLTVHVGPHLHQIAAQGLKVVANAGGVNPAGLAAALEAMIREKDLSLKVAYVAGDDLRDRLDELRAADHRDMFIDASFPDDVVSANAYLGAFPIAAALAEGADIVITGRVVDSAVVLGPLVYEFGWGADDLDLLAAGTLAGHLLECGAQVTGGTFTDWRDVPDWANIGFPIGECHADGSVVMTKPDGTGGLVSVGTVAEQILYEVSDPADYIVADVRCDFSDVRLEQVAHDRVRVTGAKGRAPTDTYKACITFDGGWRTVAYQPIIGEDAGEKAARQAEALFARARALLRARNLPDFTLTQNVLIGGEASFGAHGRHAGSREIISKLVADHPDRQGAEIFAREQWAGISGMSVGTSVNLATNVLPMTGVFLFLLGKQTVTPTMTIDGKTREVRAAAGVPAAQSAPAPRAAPDAAPAPSEQSGTAVDLVQLAWARSGDKGHLFNVAVIARRPEYLPYLRAALTCDAISDWYRHLGPEGQPPRVDRFDVPGMHAVNFVIHDALTGGINASTRLDPAAKGMAQMLLRFPVPVPSALAAQLANSGSHQGSVQGE